MYLYGFTLSFPSVLYFLLYLSVNLAISLSVSVTVSLCICHVTTTSSFSCCLYFCLSLICRYLQKLKYGIPVITLLSHVFMLLFLIHDHKHNTFITFACCCCFCFCCNMHDSSHTENICFYSLRFESVLYTKSCSYTTTSPSVPLTS